MGNEGIKVSESRLTSKEAWKDDGLVANELGFKLTPAFSDAVEQIRIKLVEDASIMKYLPIIAVGILSRVRPPLERESTRGTIYITPREPEVSVVQTSQPSP